MRQTIIEEHAVPFETWKHLFLIHVTLKSFVRQDKQCPEPSESQGSFRTPNQELLDFLSDLCVS